MATTTDDKIYVNVIKEGTEIQQTLDGQRDKFQFLHNIGITKDHFLDDLEYYRTNILHFSSHGIGYLYFAFQDCNRSTSLILRILWICSQSLCYEKIINKIRKRYENF
jgi:hypothetical protein